MGSIEHSWAVYLACGRGTSFPDVEGKEMKEVHSDVFGGWSVDIKKSVVWPRPVWLRG